VSKALITAFALAAFDEIVRRHPDTFSNMRVMDEVHYDCSTARLPQTRNNGHPASPRTHKRKRK
jgi:hypothetical protein